MPRGLLPESQEITEANQNYIKALLAFLPVLDLQQKTVADATRTSPQHVANWAAGRRTMQAHHEQALFGLLTQAAEAMRAKAWPSDEACHAWLKRAYDCLSELDGAWLEGERAYIVWVRATAAPMLAALNAKLDA